MLVCTLPSPACMCSATNTRPFRISRWTAVQRSSTGRKASPAKISSSGAFNSVFHDATTVWSCSAGKVASRRSARSRQRARRRRDQRARLVDLGVDALLRRPRLVGHAPRLRQRGRGEQVVERGAQRELVGERELDVDALDAVGVVAQARQRNHHVLVDLERVGVARDRGGARAVEPELAPRVGRDGDETFGAARRWRCAPPPRPPSPPRRRRRRRCRRPAPSSGGRGAWPWSRSRPP